MSDEVFELDNIITQNVYKDFGSRTPGQLYLPGMTPFGPFDFWAMLGVMSLIDPKNPHAPIETTESELLDILDFAKVVSKALGYETYHRKDYEMIRDSLHRLYTVEASWEGFYNTYQTDKRGKRARRKAYIEFHGRILASYAYMWAEGVTPPEHERPERKRNINKAVTLDNEPGPPIWALKDHRPIGIRLRPSPDLLNGATDVEPNIGTTKIPIRIFKLRKELSRFPTAVKLLIWTLRQTNRRPKIKMKNLCGESNLSLDPSRPAHNCEQVLKAAAMLQELGPIERYDYDEESDNLTIWKSADWHFGKGERDVAIETKEAAEVTG